MSIAATTDQGPPTWVWSVWLAAAAVMAVLFAWRRPKRGAAGPSAALPSNAISSTEATAASAATAARAVLNYQPVAVTRQGLRLVPLLAVTGLISFCVWLGVQILWVVVRGATPIGGAATTNPAAWSPVNRAALGLVSSLAAYAVGVGLLAYGGGVAAIGYGMRRVPNGLLGGVIGVFVALPVVYFALQATEMTLDRFGIDHSVKHDLLRLMAVEPSALVRTLAVLTAVVAAPLFEELLFRGCVQGGLRRATGSPLVGVVVASTVFASIHLAWTIPPIFVLSLLFGVVYERTRNLWAVTIMHALFNAFSILTTGAN